MHIESAHIVSIIALACLMLVLHKVRRVHGMLYTLGSDQRQQQSNLFRQLEALQGLYAELQFQHSLPPTREWAASPDFLLVLARHVRAYAPHTVVECSSGVSTLVLARCLQLNGRGKVYSLEHDAHYAARTREQLQRCGLQDWAVVHDAPLTNYYLEQECWPWYSLKNFPTSLRPDMLVIDGPPQATRRLARFPAAPLLFPLLAPGAAVYLDDAARPDEQAIVQRWQAAYPAMQLEQLPCEKGCAVLRDAPAL